MPDTSKVHQAIDLVSIHLREASLPARDSDPELAEKLRDLRDLLLDWRAGDDTDPGPTQTSKPLGVFGEVIVQAATDRRGAIASLKAFLRHESGRRFSSYEERHDFAKGLKAALDLLGLRIQCPSCGQPALLRAINDERYRSGYFKFEHSDGKGKTRHHLATVVLPKLTLVHA